MADVATQRHNNLLVSILLTLLLSCAALLASELITSLRQQQQLSQELAELDDVKYGLLNASRWVEHVSVILEKKIREFELTPQNRAALKRSLNRILDTLIIEVDRYMRRQNLKGKGWWDSTRGKLKQSLQDIFIDIDGIRSAIPEYADRILVEMDQPEARKELNQFLRNMLSDLANSSFAAVDMSAIDAIKERHDCQEWMFCRGLLQARLAEKERKAKDYALALLALSLAIFLLIRLESRQPLPSRFVALTVLATILMSCGVLTPMMEVEARITELRFMLLQEPVVFSDQMLYFQSKSILDMVQILTATGAVDMLVVGVLIMMFSVLFPLAKLGASVAYLYGRSALRQSGLIQFFALKSGKWSMADVMVVAIFMAYIGFDGIMSSQLSGLMEAGVNAEVLTTNGTSLEIGFFMFLSFCLTGLLSSSWMESAMGASDQAASQPITADIEDRSDSGTQQA